MAGSTRQRGTGAPTVKDVAHAAGVSPMTVSRVLAGGQNVRPALQERVHAAIAELGYRRNELARGLRPGQSSGLIGVVITNPANPYYGVFALGVEEVAAERGLGVLLGTTGESIDRERRLVSDFLGRRIEGLIVVPAGPSGEHLQPDALGDVPLVLASRLVDGVVADSVLLDDLHGARMATAELIDAGHRRIGFLGADLSVFTARRRFDGYRQALAAAGVPFDESLARSGLQGLAAAEVATTALLSTAEPPTAIFAANNRATIGAVQAIVREGIEPMPAIAGFDDIELIDFVPTTTVIASHDPRQLGATAARLLLDRLDGSSVPERHVELPVAVRTVRRLAS